MGVHGDVSRARPVATSTAVCSLFGIFAASSVYFTFWRRGCLSALSDAPRSADPYAVMAPLLLLKPGVCRQGRVVRGAHRHATRLGHRLLRLWLLQGQPLFTVIVLIGTDWSFLKPYLQ
ncbi:hypothetical protein ZWY2020_024707, partial [Hordeum vulgare]